MANNTWTRRRFLGAGLGSGAAAICVPLKVDLKRPPDDNRLLQNFTLTEGMILLAIVETMLPPGADQSRARLVDHGLFIDQYMTGLDPADIEQFRLLLYLVEHMTLPLGLKLGRFSCLDLDDRVDVLRSWQSHAVGLVRLGLRSLKTLVFLSYYRTAEAFDSIGYPGPTVAAGEPTTAPTDRYDKLVAPLDETPA